MAPGSSCCRWLAADFGAGRHHQFHDLRSRPAAPRLRCREDRGRSCAARRPAGEKSSRRSTARICARRRDDCDRGQSRPRSVSAASSAARAPVAPMQQPTSSSRRPCSIRCARRRPAASWVSRATRAIASSAGSIPNSPDRASKSRPGWCSNYAAASRARSCSPARSPPGGGRSCSVRRAPGRWADLDLAPAEQRRILEALGCVVAGDGEVLAVEPPSWRADIVGEADLVEEVLRIHGYDKIPAVPLKRDSDLAETRARRRAAPGRHGPPRAGVARSDRGDQLFLLAAGAGRAVRRCARGDAAGQPDRGRARPDAAVDPA